MEFGHVHDPAAWSVRATAKQSQIVSESRREFFRSLMEKLVHSLIASKSKLTAF